MALKINLQGLFVALLVVGSLVSANFQREISDAFNITSKDTSNVDKIVRKITIIVGDEETSTSDALIGVKNVQNAAKDCRETAKVEPRFHLDETTKLIYVDSTNESGYLIGNINNDENRTEKERSSSSERSHKTRLPRSPILDKTGSTPTNYSVFLISRSKEHIAILIDIEEIDFEPIINCEYQELRFSIVGEISKQLLIRKTGSNSSEISDEVEYDEAEDSAQANSGAQSSSPLESPSDPPLPVSEAMAMLLNSPLNKTILDESDETNDFKIIDSTIDYLQEETCNELAANQPNSESKQENKLQREKKPNRGERRKSRVKQKVSRRLRGKKKQVEHSCAHDSKQFKDLMSDKLNDYFEWDDFKIVCGKIKQLVLPMRSLRLSVYTDEFSPSSKFVVRYRFISDPSLLPAQDNGKYYCRNRNIIDLALKCNGIDDCGDASDESIKICGYPTNRVSNEPPPSSSPPSKQSSPSSQTNSTHSMHFVNQKRLTYVNGDVLHCCQSNDWLSVIPQGQSNQINLQSLIGDSMNLFSGPLFAPTRSKRGKKRVKRIVGGSVAPRGAWPGQASLQYELLEPLCHFCAGTLIHPQYVLTAGHCITKDGLNRGIKVVFGAHDLRQLNGNHIQVRYVDDAHIYPGVDVKHLNFDWENDMNNDIALLRLNAPVLITPHVAPACLPPFNTPLAVNTTCRSIGWGQTHGSGSSNMLKHLALKVVDSSLCSKELFDRDNEEKESGDKKKQASSKKSKQIKRRNRLTGDFESTGLDQYSDLTMICVNNDLGHGICQGDSGGPLYCDRVTSTGEHCTEIYGVASFIIQYATVGAMCAVENLPGIFGEVSSKTEWISSTMKMFEQTYRLNYS